MIAVFTALLGVSLSRAAGVVEAKVLAGDETSHHAICASPKLDRLYRRIHKIGASRPSTRNDWLDEFFRSDVPVQ
jgi:hypothetical protein